MMKKITPKTDREVLELLLKYDCITWADDFNTYSSYIDESGEVFGKPHWFFTGKELQVSMPWYEDIPDKGIVCYVGDPGTTHAIETKTRADVIVRYNPGEKEPFVNCRGATWTNATPVEKGDCYE